jgi:hypothetical protein
MARIRSIHPDTLESVTLAGLTDRQERTWWRLLLVCDDAGRANRSPKFLAGLLYPEVDHHGPAQVSDDLAALAGAGLILLYDVGPKRYLAVRSWHEYQHPNRPTPSRLPGPDDPAATVVPSTSNESLTESLTESPCAGDGDGDGDGDGESQNHVVDEKVLELVHPELLPASSQQAATASDVEKVFNAWAATRQHPNAVKLTAERRRLISRQLKTYPVGDLVDAVQGWQNDPFSRGDNDRGQPYNDIALILRDAGHVEKFRDLWRNGPVLPRGPEPKSFAALRRVMEAAQRDERDREQGP